ncbi:MAG: transglycosylase SLT domain-containing protein [Flavobacteriales bacterium]|nr:transglycosylase SLT domain-containing protein [Flavobacteriales bacterium]MCB9449655.1 transglycosylase SLT domain-containing protein [Flavobacteriales bacterium]
MSDYLLRLLKHIYPGSIGWAMFLLMLPGVIRASVAEPQDSIPQTRTDSIAWVENDQPVAAMLDSLLYRHYFDCSDFTTDTSVLNICFFPSDSVPRYDDAYYQAQLEKLNAGTPIDITYNDAVRKFIELYVIRKRNLSSRVLGMSELYFPMFEEVLDAYQLPLELKYLAIVESALNPSAVSSAGATGLWQFMYRTGKLFKLDVTSYVDDRRDPYQSTIAACEYLQQLYGMFHDWLLVLAAYNSGPGTVSRAIRRSGGVTDYWQLRKYLPSETRGYVPAFIAAMYFMNNAAAHNLYPIPPRKMFFEVDTVHVKQPLKLDQLSLMLNVPMEDLEYLNPVYKLGEVVLRDKKPTVLTLPVEKIPMFINNEQAIYAYQNKPAADSLPDGTAVTYVSKVVKEYHTVRRGEYLGAIAYSNNCSVEDIRAWNHLRSNMIYPGQRLVIEREIKEAVPVAQPEEIVAEKEHPSPGSPTSAEDGNYIMYEVQPGDTLLDIANKYSGITVHHLRQLNGFQESQEPKPGTKIKVSVKG